jgi:hypothetical protein
MEAGGRSSSLQAGETEHNLGAKVFKGLKNSHYRHFRRPFCRPNFVLAANVRFFEPVP